jgi:hypothetical protein
MRYLVVAISLAALTLPRVASTQATNPIDSARAPRPVARGNHVRLAVRGDAASLVGHVIRVDQTQMLVAPDDSGSLPRTIELGRVTHLEVERDEKLRSISTQIGAGVGTLAAAAYYYFGICRRNERACAREQEIANTYAQYDQTYVGVSTIVIFGGVLAGGAIGYFLTPAPHWEIVASPVVEHGAQGNARTLLRIGVARRLLGR